MSVKSRILGAYGRFWVASGRFWVSSGRFWVAFGPLPVASGRFLVASGRFLVAFGSFLSLLGRFWSPFRVQVAFTQEGGPDVACDLSYKETTKELKELNQLTLLILDTAR